MLAAPGAPEKRSSGDTIHNFSPAAPSRFSSELTLAPVAESVPYYSFILGPVVFFILVLVMYISITIFIILGATKMRKLESYGLATVGSIAAMLPCTPLFLIGLPIGIWALWALTRPEVKAAFAASKGRGTGGAAASPEAALNSNDPPSSPGPMGPQAYGSQGGGGLWRTGPAFQRSGDRALLAVSPAGRRRHCRPNEINQSLSGCVPYRACGRVLGV